MFRIEIINRADVSSKLDQSWKTVNGDPGRGDTLNTCCCYCLTTLFDTKSRVSYFFHCCDKELDKINLTKGRFIWIMVWGKAWRMRERQQVPLYPQSGSRERWMLRLSSVSPFHAAQDSRPGLVSIFTVDLLTPVNSLQKRPHRYS